VVPQVCIQEAQGFAPYGLVDHLIDTWQRIGHLGASLVQARVVGAYVSCPIIFSNKNGVRYPLRVEHLPDESGCQEPSDLLADRLPLLVLKALQALLDGLVFSRMSSECSTTSLKIPGMSKGFHAKISRLLPRKSASVLSYLSVRPAPIWTVLPSSSGST
jgi:hypothetical protein